MNKISSNNNNAVIVIVDYKEGIWEGNSSQTPELILGREDFFSALEEMNCGKYRPTIYKETSYCGGNLVSPKNEDYCEEYEFTPYFLREVILEGGESFTERVKLQTYICPHCGLCKNCCSC